VIDAQRDWASAQDDSSWRVRFHIARSVTLAHANRLGEAIDEIEAGLTLLRAAGDPLQLLPLLGNLGLLRSWRGEFAAAVEVLSEATALRDRLHGRGTSLILDLYLGAALRDLGRYCESVAMLESHPARRRRRAAHRPRNWRASHRTALANARPTRPCRGCARIGHRHNGDALPPASHHSAAAHRSH